MTDLVKKIRAWFKDTKTSKKVWNDYVARKDALPHDYKVVMDAIQNYLFNVAMDGRVMDVMYAILGHLEEGVADGRAVLEVTGDDVADFAYNVMSAIQADTWTGRKGAELNARIHRQLKEPGNDAK